MPQITEARIEEVVNGAMSNLIKVRDDVHRQLLEARDQIKEARRLIKGDTNNFESARRLAGDSIAALVADGEAAMADVQRAARIARAIEPQLKGVKAMLGKRVRIKGGQAEAVAISIAEDGIVTCCMERYLDNGQFLDIYQFDVPYLALEKI